MDKSIAEKLPYCAGCRNNFYNGQNSIGVKRCWSLDKAKVCTRYRIGWWTTPDSPGAFTKVKTLDCHHAPGQYAHYEKLPNFVSATERTRLNAAEQAP